MRIVKPKPHIPWYKQTKNKFVREIHYGDVDRKGNLFLLCVHESLNKDNELVQDIIQVKHAGNLYEDNVLSAGIIIHMTMLDCEYAWPRAIESGDISQIADYLQRKIDAGFNGSLLPRARGQILKALEKHNASI